MATSKVICDERGLLVRYVPERDGFWPLQRLADDGNFTIRRALTFVESEILERPDEDSPYEEYIFRLGEAGDGNWHIPGRILGVKHDLYIGLECKSEMKWLVAKIARLSYAPHAVKR